MVNSKIIGGIFVIGIITLLIFSAPAEAFISSIIINNNNVNKGENVIINLKVDTQDGDYPSNLTFLIFKLRGPNPANTIAVDCKFLSNGTLVSGCNGIDIEKESTVDSGYCLDYGYGPGCSFKYKLTIDTEFFDIGTYSTSLLINANGKNTTQNGENIIIISTRVCSLRASNGNVMVGEDLFSKNKLSFYIPLRKASNGQGFLNGQDNKNSLTYRFNIVKMLTMTKEKTEILVSGKFRKGIIGNFTDENATIILDKINNVTSIIGDKINAQDMKISFRQFC